MGRVLQPATIALNIFNILNNFTSQSSHKGKESKAVTMTRQQSKPQKKAPSTIDLAIEANSSDTTNRDKGSKEGNHNCR